MYLEKQVIRSRIKKSIMIDTVKLVLEILEFYSCTIRFFSEENPFINMVKCPECKKEISNPEMEFHIGRENTGNQFHYAVCSCPECKVCLGIMAV
jgi:uncharacterized protein with PIN domain